MARAAGAGRVHSRRHDVGLGCERDGLLGGDVDVLTPTREPALMECNERRRGCLCPRVKDGLGNRDPNRGTIFVAHQPERSRGGEDREVARRPTGLGSRLTEGRDRHVDERGISLRQLFEAQAEPLHLAGLAGLDQHVGALDQAQQRVTVARRLGIEDHAAFVASEGRPVERALWPAHIACKRALPPGTRPTGRLDADDVGSELAEHEAAEDPPFVGEIQDAVGAQHPKGDSTAERGDGSSQVKTRR